MLTWGEGLLGTPVPALMMLRQCWHNVRAWIVLPPGHGAVRVIAGRVQDDSCTRTHSFKHKCKDSGPYCWRVPLAKSVPNVPLSTFVRHPENREL